MRAFGVHPRSIRKPDQLVADRFDEEEQGRLLRRYRDGGRKKIDHEPHEPHEH